MALNVDDLLQITVNYQWLNQEVVNVWTYRVTASLGTDTLGQLAQAYWNHVKGVYRALAPAVTATNIFTSVIAKEMVEGGDYAEYAIPANERTGLRTFTTGDTFGASFLAVGARMTVPSSLTRAGQKRFPFVLDGDVSGNDLGPTIINLVADIMRVAGKEDIILGAPALGTTLLPVIVGEPNASRPTRVYQDVTGYIVSPYVTTQNSRKRGRGR